MKIKITQLEQIIKEEIENVMLREGLQLPITIFTSKEALRSDGLGKEQLRVVEYEPGTKEWEQFKAAGFDPGFAWEETLDYETGSESDRTRPLRKFIGKTHDEDGRPAEDIEVTQYRENYEATRQGRLSRDVRPEGVETKKIMENWKIHVAEKANAAGIENTGLFRAVRSEEEAINLNRMYVKGAPIFEMLRNGNSLSKNFEHTVHYAAPYGVVFEVRVSGPINDHDEKHMVLAENINDMRVTGVYSIKAGVWFTPEKFDEQFANIR